MPVIVRGEGVWIEDAAGRRYLDAMSGGSMAATLGHGRRDIIAAARAQAETLAFVHNERLTNPAQERLARRADRRRARRGSRRARFTVSGADANEMAIQIARSYHVERGEPDRWQVISPAQAYHGPTMETLALTGRPGMHGPFGPYLPQHLHIPPSTWRFDPSGEAALEALDAGTRGGGSRERLRVLLRGDQRRRAPRLHPARARSGKARRATRAARLPRVLRRGRDGRRADRAWFAGAATACAPDIIATAKGLGAGYAAIGAVLVREHVYEAFAQGSRRFTLGHTWDGAPLACAVGLAVLEAVRSEGLIERVHDRGAKLRDELADAPLRHPARPRGPGPRLPARGVVRRSARRRVVPPARAPGRREDRRRRVRSRADRPVDAADARRLRGRPDAVRARVHRDRRRARRDGVPVRRRRPPRWRRTWSPISTAPNRCRRRHGRCSMSSAETRPLVCAP